MITASDEALIQATLAGERRSFAELVRRHERRVEATIRGVLGNISGDDLADVAQDVFLLVYKGLASFRGNALFSTWLTRIALRHCFREQKRRRRRGSVFIQAERIAGDVPFDDRIVSGDSADGVVIADERRHAVLEALYQLPEEFRTVLVLRVVEEMQVDDVAVALDVSTGTVKSRLFRAKAKMRELLYGQDCDFETGAGD